MLGEARNHIWPPHWNGGSRFFFHGVETNCLKRAVSGFFWLGVVGPVAAGFLHRVAPIIWGSIFLKFGFAGAFDGADSPVL